MKGVVIFKAIQSHDIKDSVRHFRHCLFSSNQSKGESLKKKRKVEAPQ